MQGVRRTAPWLWTAIAIIGPATIAIVNELSKGPLVVTVIGGVTLAGALADNARKWASNRLRIGIAIDAPHHPLPANNRTTVIDYWIDRQRDICLGPLHVLQWKAERELRAMESRASGPTEGSESGWPGVPDLNGIMASLAAAQNTVSQMRAAMGFRPEDRAPEDFEREVDEYLTATRTALDAHVVADHVRSRRGVLRLRPVNGTDRTFKDVTFVLRFPAGVTPLDPEMIGEPPPLPHVPRAFGTAVPGNYLTSSLTFGPSIPGAYTPKVLVGTVDIESTSSGHVVTYPPVTLRAREHEKALPEIHLLTTPDAAPGTITVYWDATAENAEGRLSGQFPLHIGSEPYTSAELLESLIRQEADTDY